MRIRSRLLNHGGERHATSDGHAFHISSSSTFAGSWWFHAHSLAFAGSWLLFHALSLALLGFGERWVGERGVKRVIRRTWGLMSRPFHVLQSRGRSVPRQFDSLAMPRGRGGSLGRLPVDWADSKPGTLSRVVSTRTTSHEIGEGRWRAPAPQIASLSAQIANPEQTGQHTRACRETRCSRLTQGGMQASPSPTAQRHPSSPLHSTSSGRCCSFYSRSRRRRVKDAMLLWTCLAATEVRARGAAG